MEIRYNVIKESNIELTLLEETKQILVKQKGFESFEGSTHKDYREYGQIEHVKTCPNTTFGYEETKEGVPYWVLPYPSSPILDVVRKEGEEVICVSLTETELLNFGFDVPSDEVY